MVLDDYYRRIDSDHPLSVVELFADDARCFMVLDGVVTRAESKAEWEQLVRTRPSERKERRHAVVSHLREANRESVAGVMLGPDGVAASFLAHAIVEGHTIKRYSMLYTSETQLFAAELLEVSHEM